MQNEIKHVKTAKLSQKVVLVRANLDVPISNGEILDNSRIKSLIPTIEFLLSRQSKIVIIGHLGRPNGEYKEELSLMPVRFELGKLLEKTIKFANINACENSIKFMEEGDILMLENIRFSEGEESDDKKARAEMIKPLVELCDVYVNDCFAVSRPHTSVYDLALAFNERYAGFALASEIEELTKLKTNPDRPFIAVVGGAKLDTKLPSLLNLIEKVDKLLIGGAMAYPLLHVQKIKTGNQKIDKKDVELAQKLLTKAKKNRCEIVLPVDHKVSTDFSEAAKTSNTDNAMIPDKHFGLDIGKKTCELFREELKKAKTILWNGPMGIFEWENAKAGTQCIGEYLAYQSTKETYKVAGGGDTLSAMKALKISTKRFNHISMGGGMMLDFLANESFEVIEILK